MEAPLSQQQSVSNSLIMLDRSNSRAMLYMIYVMNSVMRRLHYAHMHILVFLPSTLVRIIKAVVYRGQN